MPCLFLRITLKQITLEKVLSVLPLAEHAIYGVEGAGSDNPHIHVYLLTHLTTQTLRDRLKKLFRENGADIGNKAYSFKTVPDTEDDVCRTVAYCLKLGDYVSTLPLETLERALAYDEGVKADLKKARKGNRTALVLAYLEQCASEHDATAFQTGSPQFWACPKRVARHIISYHVENQLTIRVPNVQALTDTILCRKNDYYCSLMANAIGSRFPSI